MKALVTGASSGIGKDIALYLDELGYELILVARTRKDLLNVSKLCNNKVEIVIMDLSKIDNCIKLYNEHKNVDILINNAGFGLFGEFSTTKNERELEMIDLNVKSLQVLTKLYLKQMEKRNGGMIMNVSSSAAFLPGPLMSTYYATKSYVYNLTCALYEELRRNKSKVRVSVLCPGPVDTNFNNVAKVKFSIHALSSKYVARYAVDKMLKGKLVIVPGFMTKIGVFGCKILPLKLLLKIDYKIQKGKECSNE